MNLETRRAVAWVLLVAIAVAGFYFGYKEVRKLDQLASTTQAGLIESCEINGNSTRRIKRAELKEEVLESHALPATYFPGIPPALFHRLIKEKNEKRWARFRQSKPINCVQQYTEPDRSH